MATPGQRIEEAREALRDLGLPPAQCNQMAGLVLLALADLTPEQEWAETSTRPIGIHATLLFIQEHYDVTYAENTRETVRRQVLHQFVEAVVAVANPDDPGRASNSPHYNYGLADEAAAALTQFGVSTWETAVETFRDKLGALADVYAQRRQLQQIPVVLPTGEQLSLSPGKHNELQAQVIEEFASRFTPGAKVLYLGDTAEKNLHVMHEALDELGVELAARNKLPDIVILCEDPSVLVLVEAVTSHGPVSPKRRRELDTLFAPSGLRVLFVSAFRDFAEFRNHARDIAWETEVWIAANPTHLIHYNGDRFL